MAALSLDSADPLHLLVKRSKTCAEKGMGKGASNDANQVAHFNSFMPMGTAGNHTCSILSIRLREKVCSSTWNGAPWQRSIRIQIDIFPLVSPCRAISPLCSARTDQGSNSQECHSGFARGTHWRLIWSSMQQIRAGRRIRINTNLYNTRLVHDDLHSRSHQISGRRILPLYHVLVV